MEMPSQFTCLVALWSLGCGSTKFADCAEGYIRNSAGNCVSAAAADTASADTGTHDSGGKDTGDTGESVEQPASSAATTPAYRKTKG